jgi:hypothetical protein
MPDNTELATAALKAHLEWTHAIFLTVRDELALYHPTLNSALIRQMCDMGADESGRYARILDNAVVMLLTDVCDYKKEKE